MMDYSVRGILVMLQDLQRANFGKITMTVSAYIMEESGPLVNGCIFDKDGEPHNFNFYSFDSDDKHKSEFMKAMTLINETIYGQNDKEGHPETLSEDGGKVQG